MVIRSADPAADGKSLLTDLPGIVVEGVQSAADVLEQLDGPGRVMRRTWELLTRIIEVSSLPGSLVADFLCGSGTTAAGRGSWAAADRV